MQELLLRQVQSLPEHPGVYLMKDAAGSVVYVGKAARLKDRVRSYFGSSSGHSPKTRRLVEHVHELEYIVTDSVAEALILENNLIKRHQPRYNVRLKDDKTYPYLKIDLDEPWPQVLITRRVGNDGARYFGPYANSGSVRQTLALVKKLFPYRSCTKAITGKDPRPCLDFHIHRCVGPCIGAVTRDEYMAVVQQVVLFLEGKQEQVVGDLRKQMEAAAGELQFERAAVVRDQIRAVERVIERQKIVSPMGEDQDVVGFARQGDECCVQVFVIRGGHLSGREHFIMEGTQDEEPAAIMTSFVQQYYASAPRIPSSIALQYPVNDPDVITTWLRQRRQALSSPPIPGRASTSSAPPSSGTASTPSSPPSRGRASTSSAPPSSGTASTSSAPPSRGRASALSAPPSSGTASTPSSPPLRGRASTSSSPPVRGRVREGAVHLEVPQRGAKKRFMDLVVENARQTLEQLHVRWLADTGKTAAALTELQEMLDLPRLPRRIECYDISNISGTSSVGSMVVFDDGKPRNTDYRRFRIKTVTGSDDYSMMQEMLRRRFKRATGAVLGEDGEPNHDREAVQVSSSAFRVSDTGLDTELETRNPPSCGANTEHENRNPSRGAGNPKPETRNSKLAEWAVLPDLVIIDGGRGHLTAAMEVIQSLGLHTTVPTCALAKQQEEIFLPHEAESVLLPRGSQGLYLVQRVRDEAHRFAITYHRQVRSKAAIASGLEEVPGVGPRRRKALLQRFGSIRALKDAPLEEITAVRGMTRTLAEKVKAHS